MKTKLPIIGIDPGVSNGCITVYYNKRLSYYHMPEKIEDIITVLKKYGGDPADDRCRCSIEKIGYRHSNNSFINSHMQPLYKNFDRLKSALVLCNIPFKEVAPQTWQKWHGLILPKGVREKGLDKEYDELMYIKNELAQIPKHIEIEKKMKYVTKHENGMNILLKTEEIRVERDKLNDRFSYFTVKQLKEAQKEIEKRIDAINRAITAARKKRYQAKAQALTKDDKLALWKADATLLCVYEVHN